METMYKVVKWCGFPHEIQFLWHEIMLVDFGVLVYRTLRCGPNINFDA